MPRAGRLLAPSSRPAVHGIQRHARLGRPTPTRTADSYGTMPRPPARYSSTSPGQTSGRCRKSRSTPRRASSRSPAPSAAPARHRNRRRDRPAHRAVQLIRGWGPPLPYMRPDVAIAEHTKPSRRKFRLGQRPRHPTKTAASSILVEAEGYNSGEFLGFAGSRGSRS